MILDKVVSKFAIFWLESKVDSSLLLKGIEEIL